MRLASPEHLSLAPPPEPGQGRAMGLSLLAHAALALALAWGVRWNASNPQVAFTAEIWSPTAQEAAPAAVEPPPPPPPAPETRPAPPPPPAAREPESTKADIALEKKRKQDEERQKAQAQKAKAEKEKAEKEKAEKDKLAKDKARKEEEARKQKEQKEREKTKEQARKEAAAQAAQDKLRQEQLQRIQGLAGATGGPEARGSAQRSAAPSSSYAGKIIRLVKDNVSYAGSASGNPTVVVLVKAAPSGSILSRKVVTPSGNKDYDEAVLRAVDKMGSVPKDVDGRIPEVLLQEGLEIKVTL